MLINTDDQGLQLADIIQHLEMLSIPSRVLTMPVYSYTPGRTL